MTATLRLGATGVGVLHQRLIEANYNVDQSELISGIYGKSTEKQVKDFQASHIGPRGTPLNVDGMVGPDTLWAINNPGALSVKATVKGWKCDLDTDPKVRAIVRPVLLVARELLGVAETPGKPNRGPKIDVFTQPQLGSPWCLWFISHCYNLGCPLGSPFGRIGSAWGMLDWAEKNGRLIYTNHPDVKKIDCKYSDLLPGDLFLILRGERRDRENRRGHGSMLCNVDTEPTFSTLGGNESDMVRGNLRTLASAGAIVRPLLAAA